jgi:large conductance mechanosensitive channel
MGIVADFKAFVTKDTFAVMAVGIVVGIAVTTVVTGLIGDLINPLIGLALHGNLDSELIVSFGGSTFLFGAFISALINFVVVLAVIFFAIVYPLAKRQERIDARKAKAPPTTRECPECCSTISRKAKRCAFCASTVAPAA